MKARKPEATRGLIGVACSALFAIYAFNYSGDAMASRAPAAVPVSMPTSAEFSAAERRLAKTTRKDTHADSCLRGQLVGGAEVHVAMNFAPLDRPATEQRPGLARVHAKTVNGADKALVLESKDPTVWQVTGETNTIILMGNAVLGSYPEGARVFAPRFASGCQKMRWVKLPNSWSFPANRTVMDSLMDDLGSRFSKRAATISTEMFNRPDTSWRVRRGSGMMTF